MFATSGANVLCTHCWLALNLEYTTRQGTHIQDMLFLIIEKAHPKIEPCEEKRYFHNAPILTKSPANGLRYWQAEFDGSGSLPEPDDLTA